MSIKQGQSPISMITILQFQKKNCLPIAILNHPYLFSNLLLIDFNSAQMQEQVSIEWLALRFNFRNITLLFLIFGIHQRYKATARTNVALVLFVITSLSALVTVGNSHLPTTGCLAFCKFRLINIYTCTSEHISLLNSH